MRISNGFGRLAILYLLVVWLAGRVVQFEPILCFTVLPEGSKIMECIDTLRSLRATAATLLLDPGVDIMEVRELPGPSPCHHHPNL